MARFNTDLKHGKRMEERLDKRFSSRYHITATTFDEDLKGIDRIFEDKRTGLQYKIQYKSDKRTAETQNLFMETMSVYDEDKPERNREGWVYTCKSDFIIYHSELCECGHTIIFPTKSMTNEVILNWRRTRIPEPVWNEEGEYYSYGYPVPVINIFKELEGCKLIILWEEYKKTETMCDCFREKWKYHHRDKKLDNDGNPISKYPLF